MVTHSFGDILLNGDQPILTLSQKHGDEVMLS